jgi:hypothetical protein
MASPSSAQTCQNDADCHCEDADLVPHFHSIASLNHTVLSLHRSFVWLRPMMSLTDACSQKLMVSCSSDCSNSNSLLRAHCHPCSDTPPGANVKADEELARLVRLIRFHHFLDDSVRRVLIPFQTLNSFNVHTIPFRFTLDSLDATSSPILYSLLVPVYELPIHRVFTIRPVPQIAASVEIGAPAAYDDPDHIDRCREHIQSKITSTGTSLFFCSLSYFHTPLSLSILLPYSIAYFLFESCYHTPPPRYFFPC